MANVINESGIIGIIGDRGSGKTCFMTRLLLQDYNNGRKIITNYWVDFPHTKMSFEDLANLPTHINGSTIALDEIHVAVDSRESMSSINKQLTKLATQLRKRNIILYYTTQRFNLIDKRLRDQTDYLVRMSPASDGIFIASTYNRWTLDKPLTNKRFDGKPFYKYYDTTEVIDF